MSTSADVMLQLRLLLHVIFLALTRIPTHVAIQRPMPIFHILISAHISTHIHTSSTTPTLTLDNILTLVLPRHAPIPPRRGTPLHRSLLAG